MKKKGNRPTLIFMSRTLSRALDCERIDVALCKTADPTGSTAQHALGAESGGVYRGLAGEKASGQHGNERGHGVVAADPTSPTLREPFRVWRSEAHATKTASLHDPLG